MSDATSKLQDVVMDVIRGVRTLQDLDRLGLTVREDDGRLEVAYAGDLVVAPHPCDVAQGFRTYLASQASLQRWAAILLAATSLIDLHLLESAPYGERLLEGLWDAADSIPLSFRTIETIAQFSPHISDTPRSNPGGSAFRSISGETEEDR